jgi:hypothetical protein
MAATIPGERPRIDYLRCVEAGVTGRPVAVQTEREPQTVGELIRFGRTQRPLMQMELALDANLSLLARGLRAALLGAALRRGGDAALARVAEQPINPEGAARLAELSAPRAA